MFLAAKGSELMSQKREKNKISNHKNKLKSFQLYCHFFYTCFLWVEIMRISFSAITWK